MSTHTGQVIDLSSDGWGVVRSPSGEITFVPGTWLGDEITFEIISTGKFRMGKVVEWIKKSAAHRESPCKHFGRESTQCGACVWMDIHYVDQVQAKEKRLSAILQRFRIEFNDRAPIAVSSEFKYRNRIKLNSDAQKLGFIAPRSHNLVPIEECLVAEDWINTELAQMRSQPLEKKEYWIQRGDAGAFAQGNSAQNAQMRSTLLKLLDQKYAVGLELFCGEGNFSAILQSHIAQLSAYESSADAIQKLLTRHPLIHGKTKDLYAKNAVRELARECSTAEILFLDPPRSGFKDLAALVGQLKHLKRIIYLSCDPMTFARDIAALSDWRREKIFAFDLFPQTPHLEVMGSLVRKDALSPEQK